MHSEAAAQVLNCRQAVDDQKATFERYIETPSLSEKDAIIFPVPNVMCCIGGFRFCVLFHKPRHMWWG